MGIMAAKAKMQTAEDQAAAANLEYSRLLSPPASINTNPIMGYGGGGGYAAPSPDYTATGPESPATQQPSMLPYLIAGGIALYLLTSK
jgi:hypothetical protein